MVLPGKETPAYGGLNKEKKRKLMKRTKRKREKEKKKKRKRGRFKSIKKVGPRQQRRNKKNKRKREKEVIAVLNYTRPPNSQHNHDDPQKAETTRGQDRKKVRKNMAKAYRQIKKLKVSLDKERRQTKKWKKRYNRLRIDCKTNIEKKTTDCHGVKMDNKHKKLLQRNWTYLLDNIVLKDLLDYMFEKDIITVAMMEDVNARRTPRDKISHFLLTLQRRGPLAFDIFIAGLRETGQDFIADRLLSSLQGQMEQ